MSKKFINILIIILGIVFVLLGVASFFTESLIFRLEGGGNATALKNPVIGLSDEEAAEQFDETFVRYLLYNIGARNLHNPPFSSDTPKIVIYVDELIFNAEVTKGKILVKRAELESEDIIIKTTKTEAVRMMRDKSYVEESFKRGSSNIELVASKTRLFAKGYAKIYTTVTGKTVAENKG